MVIVSVGGNKSDPSQGELAQFCRAWSEMVDTVEEEDPSRTVTRLEDLDRRLADLEQAEANIEATAPAELKDDFAVQNRFDSLSETDQFRPAERDKNENAKDRIGAFVDEECRL